MYSWLEDCLFRTSFCKNVNLAVLLSKFDAYAVSYLKLFFKRIHFICEGREASHKGILRRRCTISLNLYHNAVV